MDDDLRNKQVKNKQIDRDNLKYNKDKTQEIMDVVYNLLHEAKSDDVLAVYAALDKEE